jgi:hypothetical protein
MQLGSRSYSIGMLAAAFVAGAGTVASLAAKDTELRVDHVYAKQITLVKDDGTPVVTQELTRNSQGDRQGRYTLQFHGGFSSEIMTVPGDRLKCAGNICGQIMQLGPLPARGRGRTRLAESLTMDRAGSLAAVIDATTTDASNTMSQKNAPPLCLNSGEAKGVYICIYPNDNTIDIQDRMVGTATGRMRMPDVIRKLRLPSR